ncbi:MAG: helix-turn-helix transcriptional regulator [Saprospiraceae bacterium]|nr:helix-turn-helix transcriptional regulator [Saprospiraceae bacterium]
MDERSFHTTIYQPVQLARFIDRYIIYHFREDEEILFFPEGHFDLILQSDQDILYRSDSMLDWISRPRLFVGGLHSRSYSVKPARKNTHLISIQFKANGANYFIPEKLHLYKNKIIDLLDVFNVRQLDKLEHVRITSDFPEILKELETFLLSIFRERADSPVDTALALLQQQNGFCRMDELAWQTGISRSQFRKRFREEIGMSPKEYSKILRINAITRHLTNSNNTGNLTNLTYQLGYFDQSHLIKDFQSVAGMSPKKFQRKNWENQSHC